MPQIACGLGSKKPGTPCMMVLALANWGPKKNEADQISREAVPDLFTGRHDLLDVMRWKEIYGRLENAADQCEDVANTIESIVIKNS